MNIQSTQNRYSSLAAASPKPSVATQTPTPQIGFGQDAFVPTQEDQQPPAQDPRLPKAAWSGLSVAYGVGGGLIVAAMVGKAIAGSLTPGLALAGTLVAGGAFANAYLLHKTTQG